MEPVLDCANPLPAVLRPGERVIWVGRPKGWQQGLPATPYLVMLAAGLGLAADKFVFYCMGPLPPSTRMELLLFGGISAVIIIAPFYYLRRQVRETTYAITSQRLLMAIGPDRGQIRELTLGSLGSTRVHYVRNYGTVLDFTIRGAGPKRAVWTFLESGKHDRWYTPWKVDDPESVRQLIETASNDYWGSAKAT